MAKASEEAARYVGLEEDEAIMGGPGSKMAIIAARARFLEHIQRFESPGARANVFRSCELSLRSVASGVTCWGDFCELAGRELLPPSGEAASEWPAYFSAGRASQQYLPHLQKACVFLGCSLEWKSEAVARAARGLARAGGRIHVPKPVAARSLFGKITSRNLTSETSARAVWVSWMCPLRVQSRCPRLARQLPRGMMDEKSALGPPAAIGLEKGYLAIKPRRRKHVAGASRMGRKCICQKYPDGSPEVHAP